MHHVHDQISSFLPVLLRSVASDLDHTVIMWVDASQHPVRVLRELLEKDSCSIMNAGKCKLMVLVSTVICAVAVLVSFRDIVTQRVKLVKPFSPLPGVIYTERVEATEAAPARVPSASETSDAEALASLHAALEMRRTGKADKALKLFQHAFALSPKHADVLNHYGEFLEDTEQDVVTADRLYTLALSNHPEHSGALINRQRTASIVENLDREMLQKIDEKRDALSSIPDGNAALRRAKKEAYFQHIYHTVGIEGNTMTLQQTRSILETRIAVSGKSIDEHNEILGLDAAMKYINATLLYRLRDVTVGDILEIHRRVLGHVDPVEGGQFRTTQVFVGGHVPPGPSHIHTLMKQFLDWLNSEEALELHPVRLIFYENNNNFSSEPSSSLLNTDGEKLAVNNLDTPDINNYRDINADSDLPALSMSNIQNYLDRYAALAHYKLVHIHPFVDGNGRTSRLLMNLLLMQAGFPPVIILKQHRQLYYRHLQTANQGDVRPFVRFIAQCTERTLNLYLWATSEYAHMVPAIGEPAILRTGAGSSFDDMDL